MAVDMFLKIATVDGESTDSVHSGEIDLLSWSFAANQTGTSNTGGGSRHRSASQASAAVLESPISIRDWHAMAAPRSGVIQTECLLVKSSLRWLHAP